MKLLDDNIGTAHNADDAPLEGSTNPVHVPDEAKTNIGDAMEIEVDVRESEDPAAAGTDYLSYQ